MNLMIQNLKVFLENLKPLSIFRSSSSLWPCWLVSNAYMDHNTPCKTKADCGDDDCIGGFCFEVVKTPKNIDTLTAAGAPKRKGYMDPVQPKKCETNADCGDGADDQCVGGLCFEVVKTPKN
ncbi:hypothetical protein L5515_013551 [Caenorhabditis briggsae]|uniref:Uncharacterized protein n=1 Tax=Caenorhabditis briggsae TaxID=6238 RepID=A0AAE9J6A4_CAEBR|nr:hypothetical protein L5515_013551 [Caenorhabditis briggsae]